MNAQLASQNINRTSTATVPGAPKSIMETRVSELDRAMLELEEAVDNTIRRLSPILSPYPTAMPATGNDASKSPPMAPLVNDIEDKTSRVNALRHRITEAMANAQI